MARPSTTTPMLALTNEIERATDLVKEEMRANRYYTAGTPLKRLEAYHRYPTVSYQENIQFGDNTASFPLTPCQWIFSTIAVHVCINIYFRLRPPPPHTIPARREPTNDLTNPEYTRASHCPFPFARVLGP